MKYILKKLNVIKETDSEEMRDKLIGKGYVLLSDTSEKPDAKTAKASVKPNARTAKNSKKEDGAQKNAEPEEDDGGLGREPEAEVQGK